MHNGLSIEHLRNQ